METAALGNGRRHWSTADVAPERALSYWVETIGQSMLAMEIDSDERAFFRARLDQATLGPATLNMIQARRQQIRRTPSNIARSSEAYCFLVQLRSGGAFRLTQYGREANLRPGECVVLDGVAPYHILCPQETRCVAIRFSRDWLSTWVPSPEDLAARMLSSTNGWSRALAAALSTLDVSTCNDLALPRGVVAEQLAALLAMAAGPAPQRPTTKRALYDKLMQSLRERYHEPTLTPEALALEHGISKRYVHYAFAQAQTRFGDRLIDVRLERAQQLLSDRRFADLPISDISSRCGFLEPSHFARRFRRRFGQNPAAFRKIR